MVLRFLGTVFACGLCSHLLDAIVFASARVRCLRLHQGSSLASRLPFACLAMKRMHAAFLRREPV